MAKVSAMPAVTAGDVVDADEFYILDGGVSKKISAVNLAQISQITSRYVAQSTLTTDGDVLTRASGSPARITRADLAQDTAFSSRYKPLASDRLWIGYEAMVRDGANGLFGGSYTSSERRLVGATFDQSTDEKMDLQVVIPTGWTTFDAYLWWGNGSTGVGDVRWGFYFAGYSAGATTDVAHTLDAYTVAAPAQYVTDRLKINSSAIAVSAGQLFHIEVFRAATSVADTLANDAVALGIELVRVS